MENNNLKFSYFHSRRNNMITEGGGSRNKAFYDFFKNNYSCVEISTSRNVCTIFFNQLIYIFHKKEIVVNLYDFVHQNKLIIILVKCGLSYIADFLIFLCNLNKNIYIEVNDLPVEQYIDLELDKEGWPMPSRLIYDYILSRKSLHYIFASKEMQKYCIKKYNLPYANTFACINGGQSYENFTQVEFKIDSSKINCLYAGSLNQGRQIDLLLNSFKSNNSCVLYLCGDMGEWLLDINLPINVVYLGSFSEEEVSTIARYCDIGLVPYDSSRFYYNLCYPTKNSFYLVNELVLFSTKLSETMEQIPREFAYFENIEDWEEVLSKITKKEIDKKRKIVLDNKSKYEWNYLLTSLIYSICKEKI